jgi:ABC-2 type transport system permease protein
MNVIARVFRYEFSRQGRRRGYLFVTLGLPLIALVIYFGLRFIQERQANGSAPANPARAVENISRQVKPNGVVDKSGLLKLPPFGNLIQYGSEEEALAALREGAIGSYYVVAADYVESGKVDMYFDRFNLGNISNAALRQALVQALIARSGKQVDPAVIARLQDGNLRLRGHTIADGGGTQQGLGEATSLILVYMFAFLLLFTAFTTSGYLMQSVVEEKETRMVEVLLSSMRPVHLLAGKILALGLLGLIQMAAWGAATLYIFNQLAPTTPALAGLKISNTQLIVLLVYFILGYLFFASAYASIGALSVNMREGPQLAVAVTLPAVVPMWGSSLIATAPNGGFAVAMSIFPLTAPLGMVMRVGVTEVPLGELALSIGLLTLTVMFMIWLAGRLFRVSTLLSGRVPRLRELPQLLR